LLHIDDLLAVGRLQCTEWHDEIGARLVHDYASLDCRPWTPEAVQVAHARAGDRALTRCRRAGQDPFDLGVRGDPIAHARHDDRAADAQTLGVAPEDMPVDPPVRATRSLATRGTCAARSLHR